jgi:hypothetical protein
MQYHRRSMFLYVRGSLFSCEVLINQFKDRSVYNFSLAVRWLSAHSVHTATYTYWCELLMLMLVYAFGPTSRLSHFTHHSVWCFTCANSNILLLIFLPKFCYLQYSAANILLLIIFCPRYPAVNILANILHPKSCCNILLLRVCYQYSVFNILPSIFWIPYSAFNIL